MKLHFLALTAALVAPNGYMAPNLAPADTSGERPATVAGQQTLAVNRTLLWQPSVVRTVGKRWAYYEIELRNRTGSTVTLKSTRVADSKSPSKPLLELSGAALLRSLGVYTTRPETPTAELKPGGLTLLYMAIPFSEKGPLPSSLTQQISVDVGGSEELGTVVVRLEQKPAALIGPPLKGGGWFAANALQNDSGHRRALLRSSPTESSIAQRFAIDWLRFGSDGKAFQGDPKKNQNWHGYGSDLLAVAAGTVLWTQDGIEDNVPFEAMKGPMTLETIGGNAVLLDIGGGRYAFYGHLKHGSLRVKRGDVVKKGQVLGLLGNSGNSDAPHLHFHIVDGPSAMEANGVPFAFESFEYVGDMAPGDFLRAGRVVKGSGKSYGKRSNEMPGFPMVVRFKG